MLASGSRDCEIKLWDTESYKEVASLQEHTEEISSLSFNSKGNILVSGSFDKTIKIWDIKHKTVLKTLKGNEDRI